VFTPRGDYLTVRRVLHAHILLQIEFCPSYIAPATLGKDFDMAEDMACAQVYHNSSPGVHNEQQLACLLEAKPVHEPCFSSDHYHSISKEVRHRALIAHTARFPEAAAANGVLTLRSIQYVGHHGNPAHSAAAAVAGNPNPQLSPTERAKAAKMMLRQFSFMMTLLSSKELRGVPAECDEDPLLLWLELAWEKLPFWMRDLAVAPYDSESDLLLWTSPPTSVPLGNVLNPLVDESQVVGGEQSVVDDYACLDEALPDHAVLPADVIHETKADQHLQVLEESSANRMGVTNASAVPELHDLNASGMFSRWAGRKAPGLPYPAYAVLWRQEKDGIRKTDSTASTASIDDACVVWVSARYGFYLEKASGKWRRAQNTIVQQFSKTEADALFEQLLSGACNMDNPFYHLESAHYMWFFTAPWVARVFHRSVFAFMFVRNNMFKS